MWRGRRRRKLEDQIVLNQTVELIKQVTVNLLVDHLQDVVRCQRPGLDRSIGTASPPLAVVLFVRPRLHVPSSAQVVIPPVIDVQEEHTVQNLLVWVIQQRLKREC